MSCFTFTFPRLLRARPIPLARPTLKRSIPTRQSFFTSSKQSIKYYAQPPPPPRGKLDFLNRIPTNTVFYGILGLNGVVFGMWYMAKQKYRYERDPSAYKWMQENFTSSWWNVKNGHYWSLVTACFSHQDLSHILLNGFTFFFMSPVVLRMVGSKRFIGLYLGCGVASSIASLLYAGMVFKQDRPSHGASGAIMGIVSFLTCAAPTLTFRLYGIIPMPAWLLTGAIFSYDVYQTLNDSGGQVDTVGHVGGAVSGAVLYMFMRKRLRMGGY